MRFTFKDLDPAVYTALAALESYVRSSTALSARTKELMKIRASQINGCAYCINMHAEKALQAGETAQRIFLVSAWRETSIFTEEERILLAMTEEITEINRHGLTDATYGKAIGAFGDSGTAAALMTIISINNWNRMVVSGQMPID
jgi:AhpD family alkylhydroperoxidase